MTLRTWAFYDCATGLFTGRHVLCNEDDLARNTPAGCAAMEGRHDRLTECVDIATRAVVERVRPQEEIDAEMRERRAQAARIELERLERRQLRPIRELQLDPQNAKARRRLAEIEARIVELRAEA